VLVPGGTYEVTIHSAGADQERMLSAGRRGRISLRVPLGPSNTAQQYTAGATTRVFHTRVSLRRVPASSG
jgi:hypothetical protein